VARGSTSLFAHCEGGDDGLIFQGLRAWWIKKILDSEYVQLQQQKFHTQDASTMGAMLGHLHVNNFKDNRCLIKAPFYIKEKKSYFKYSHEEHCRERVAEGNRFS